MELNSHDSRHLANQAQDVLEEKAIFQCINLLKPSFSKDGNQYCFLYGDNLQIGVAGFGQTVIIAARNFYNAITTEKIK